MRASATAGIDFFGTAMRYSEVEQFGAQHRLLRLGDCDFEFDVSNVLFQPGSNEYMDVISDAISEIFHGTNASHFRFVIHPTSSRYFTSYGAAERPDELQTEHAALESALLYDSEPGNLDRRIGTGITDKSDQTAAPLLVTEFSHLVKPHLDKLMEGIAGASFDSISATEALIHLERRRTEKTPVEAPQVMIGVFDTYVEYTLMKSGQWVHSHTRVEREGSDIAYFVLHVLEQAGVSADALAAIEVYGTAVSTDLVNTLRSVFGPRARPLNPVSVVDLEADQFDEGFHFESFVLCLGAAL